MIKNPTYRGVVHPWQCDHMGHMNVMFYVSKFDEASWNFFSMIGLSAKRMSQDNAGVAAVQQNIRYERELFPGDTVVVLSRVLEVRDKLIRFEHKMNCGETGELCATNDFTVVYMDHKTRKASLFPDDVRETLQQELDRQG
jgi:acyl-CoA thioester hydrolase